MKTASCFLLLCNETQMDANENKLIRDFVVIRVPSSVLFFNSDLKTLKPDLTNFKLKLELFLAHFLMSKNFRSDMPVILIVHQKCLNVKGTTECL